MPKINPNEICIIGGKWRSRKLRFPPISELRPTPNRVRETLFNWLAPYLPGAVCLDLFAGTGALGFEALSRGARSVVMIDQSPEVVNYLKNQAQVFNAATEVNILQMKFPEINLPHQIFDIIFLDPPFGKNLISQSCQWLQDNNLLTTTSLIYIEAEAELKSLPLPQDWVIYRDKIAGQVRYSLIKPKFN